MPIYHPRPGAHSYGHDIGVLLIDCVNPFPPGDVGNASSYNYPVLFHTIRDVTIEALLDRGDTSLMPNVLKAAQYLEAHGVKAITSDCGYMLHFQHLIAGAVKVPVMLSPLLQLPFIGATLGQGRAIGVICAKKPRMTPELLARAWPNPTCPIHVAGLEGSAAFRVPIMEESGPLDTDAVEADVVAIARDLVREHPEIGVLLLECSNIPLYSHAVQRATGLPVFDFMTMINQMHAACVQRPYAGSY
jgi:hypothetical protein